MHPLLEDTLVHLLKVYRARKHVCYYTTGTRSKRSACTQLVVVVPVPVEETSNTSASTCTTSLLELGRMHASMY
jgi:hypothetical protein